MILSLCVASLIALGPPERVGDTNVVKTGAFLPAISIQIVQVVAMGWPHAAGMSAWAVPFGVLFLVVAAIGMMASGFTKVAGATRPNPRRPVSSRPGIPALRVALAARCAASHADCAPLAAPPTALRTLRRFQRTAGPAGSEFGNSAAHGRAPRQAGRAAAWSNGVARLRAGPGGACRPD